MALIVLLVAGTVAYAGIHALLSPAVPFVADSSRGVLVLRDAAPDPLVTLDAVILAMIGLLAVVGASSPPRRDSTVVPNR
jgi:hypothetical protein